MNRRAFLGTSSSLTLGLAFANPQHLIAQARKSVIFDGQAAQTLRPHPSRILGAAASSSIAGLYRNRKMGITTSASTAYAFSITFVEDQVESGQMALDENYILSHQQEFLSYVPSDIDKANVNQTLSTYGIGLGISILDTISPDYSARLDLWNTIKRRGLERVYLDSITRAARNVDPAVAVAYSKNYSGASLKLANLDTLSCQIIKTGELVAGLTGNVPALIVLGLWDIVSCT